MTTQQRALFWNEHLNAWQASGLSGQAFCQQHHLIYHQFLYWRQKQIRSEHSSSAVGFARVAPVTTTDGELRINLPSGVSITGIHAGNVTLLGTLLRQL